MPKIYNNNFPDITKVHKLVECMLEPPTTLKIPLLPFNCHAPLVFALHRTYMEKQNMGEWQHDSEMPKFRGTFCTPQLQKALNRKYKIGNIYGVWEFQMRKGLFQDYVGSFPTIKQEATGLTAQ